MKRPLVVLAVLVSALTLTTPNSSAIFGLSACEKMKNAILIEEKIGKKAWQSYDTQRDAYVRSGAISASHLIEVLDQLTLVYNSDLILFRKLDSNPKCVSASNSADVRAQIQETKKSLAEIADARKEYKKLSFAEQKSIFPKSVLDWLKRTYPSYGSIFSTLK